MSPIGDFRKSLTASTASPIFDRNSKKLGNVTGMRIPEYQNSGHLKENVSSAILTRLISSFGPYVQKMLKSLDDLPIFKPNMEPHDFSVELAGFEKKKPELLNLCEGKFGVFKGDRFLGAFDSYLAAYQAGLKEWGNVPFLIKQILKQERSETMPALVLGLINANL